MDDLAIIEIAASLDSATDGVLMDALDDAGYAAAAQELRWFRDITNVIQLEYWRVRISGEREIWTPATVDQYWQHIQSLRGTYIN